jgi:hypothetical protein
VWFKSTLIQIYQFAEPAQPALPPETAPEPLSHLQQLRQRNIADARAGKCVDMNDLLRSVPKPRPPKKPSWER